MHALGVMAWLVILWGDEMQEGNEDIANGNYLCGEEEIK